MRRLVMCVQGKRACSGDGGRSGLVHTSTQLMKVCTCTPGHAYVILPIYTLGRERERVATFATPLIHITYTNTIFYAITYTAHI